MLNEYIFFISSLSEKLMFYVLTFGMKYKMYHCSQKNASEGFPTNDYFRKKNSIINEIKNVHSPTSLNWYIDLMII